MTVRTYTEARALATSEDPRIPFTMPGRGSTAYVALELDDGAVRADLRGTAVVTFRPDVVEVRTGRWVTRTTGEAIDAALNIPGAFTTISRVPYVLGHRMTEPTVLDYTGARVGPLDLNDELSPLADPRRARLNVADLAQDRDGTRVTLCDWTYDGRDHTPTMRTLAAAYVGHPRARTRVVGRFGYPTTEEPNVSILVIHD